MISHLESIEDENEIVIWRVLKNSKVNQYSSKTGAKGNSSYANQDRCSNYRGVCRNGPAWQVAFICNQKREYVGGFNSEEEAARTYDEMNIRANGIKAKTNYNYTKKELLHIASKYCDI